MKIQYKILEQQVDALSKTVSSLKDAVEDGVWKQAGQIIKQNLSTVDSIKATMKAMIDISHVND